MRTEKHFLEKYWNHDKVCRNPHKGWYLHYFDNGLKKYGSRLASGDFLEDFPGLNHIYLRLAWSYLEPREGDFNWRLIDDVIEKWTAHSYKVSFRISCKETNPEQCYATPEWVMNAGCNGTYYTCKGGGRVWEPDYGDPVFLEKLENFHRAFAERYDGSDWVEFVDIGSYGEWGEGHTCFSSKKDWPIEVIKKHIDIHLRHYKNSLLMANYDLVYGKQEYDGTEDELIDHIVKNRLAIRCDSVCVRSYSDSYGFSTLKCPEFYDLFWLDKPVDLEFEHYQPTVDNGTWMDGLPFIQAVREAHATFIGFHGYAREWLSGNRTVASKLANLAGYWYFLKSIEHIAAAKRNNSLTIRLVWENHGVAPSYKRFDLALKLKDMENGREAVYPIETSDNCKWIPGRIIEERCTINLHEALNPGNYRIGLALKETGGREIELGLADSIKEEGFYFVSQIEITDI